MDLDVGSARLLSGSQYYGFYDKYLKVGILLWQLVLNGCLAAMVVHRCGVLGYGISSLGNNGRQHD
jgi:hypothetical protein